MALANLIVRCMDMNKEKKRQKKKNSLLTIENKLMVTRREVDGGWVE